MSNFSALKTAIQNAIKQNGNEEITGDVLQQILLSIVSTMGDGAINTIEQNLSQETTDRQEADTQLHNAINAINTYLAKGYIFAGVATPTGTPVSGKVFYVATTAGTYTYFGNLQVQNGISILLVENGSWTLHQLLVVDFSLVQNSNNPVRGGAVYQAIQHEETERQAADTRLQKNINNEKSRAVGVENGLHQEIAAETDKRKQEIQGMRDDVLDLIHEYRPIEIEGNVVNAPDEEDITQQPNNLLKFKDKDYNPTIFSGLGRKYLRKNIIINEDYTSFDGFEMNPEADAMLEAQPDSIFWDRLRERFIAEKDGVYYLDWQDSGDYIPVSADKIYVNENIPYFWNGEDLVVDDDVIARYGNILTQEMMSDANTIYVIQYDYTLGENITVPANCVLEFDGGSISGTHTITGSNTVIKAGLVKIFNTDVTLAGSWKVAQTMSKWFGAIGDGVTDDTIALQKFVNVGTNLLLNSGTYKITDTISIPACKSLDGSWAIINIEKENIVGLLYEGIDTDHYNLDTVLHNIRIRSSYDGVIAIKFGEGVYFNYLYDFDIAITGENAIGIVETNNFNVIIRDGRIIGKLPYKNGSIGVLLTTNSQSSFNSQVTNILVDSVLIQRFDKCIKLDYGTTAHDTIMFSNIGFSSANIGYYIKGYISATIVNQRIEGSNKLLSIVQSRDISIRDIYIWNSGFLDMEAGSLIISGYLDAMNNGAAQVADKQFAKITSGYCRLYGRLNSYYGYGVDDEITGTPIIGLNNQLYDDFAKCASNIGGFLMDSNKTPRYKRGQNDEVPIEIKTSPLNSVNWNASYTTLSIDNNIYGYKLYNKIDSVSGGYNGQKVTLFSGDGKSYYVNIENSYLKVDKHHSIIIYKDNGTWKFDGGASATPVYNTLPTLDATLVGTMYFDNANKKPVWWNGSAWVDATGATV